MLDSVLDVTETIASPAAITGVLRGLKVLVVDDGSRCIYAVRTLLQTAHADVVVVAAGTDAIMGLTASDEIDIVLIDVAIPSLDGCVTMRATRSLAQFASLPILAVTNKSRASERQRCLDAGADDYMPRPQNIRELVAALRPWLPARSIAAA